MSWSTAANSTPVPLREVAGLAVLVAVRDSEKPDSAHLAVDPRAWAAFVRSLQVRRPRRAGVRRQEESRGGDHRGRDGPPGGGACVRCGCTSGHGDLATRQRRVKHA
nr:DUF397 domain-containing protein [Streptomyces sp. PBH53]